MKTKLIHLSGKDEVQIAEQAIISLCRFSTQLEEMKRELSLLQGICQNCDAFWEIFPALNKAIREIFQLMNHLE